jgi:hypothetical protein
VRPINPGSIAQFRKKITSFTHFQVHGSFIPAGKGQEIGGAASGARVVFESFNILLALLFGHRHNSVSVKFISGLLSYFFIGT